MAWQVGSQEYKKKMKILKNRRPYVEDFVKNSKYNSHIRDIVRTLMLENDSMITAEAARLKLLEFMGSNEEG